MGQTRIKCLTPVSNDKGIALIMALTVLIILSALGIFATNSSVVEIWRSANYRSLKQAFYAADAGIEDGISRLVSNPSPVTDSAPTDTSWTPTGSPYHSANFTSPANPSNSFTITHRLVGNPSVVGVVGTSSGSTQYLITSTGTSGTARAKIKAVIFLNSSPFQTGMVGCDSVTIHGSGAVDSYNSQSGTYAAQATHTDAQNNTYANSNGSASTTNANATTTLSGSSVDIHGNVSSPTIINENGNPKVYGTQTPNTPTSPCDPIGVTNLVSNQMPAGNPADVNLGQGGNVTVTAPTTITTGNFNLGNNSIYRIAKPAGAGPFAVTMIVKGNLSIGSTAQLQIDSGVNVTIYTTGSVDLGGHGVANGNSNPSSLIIYSSTTNSSPNGVQVTGGSNFVGAIYAPLGDVSLAGNTQFYGAMRGKNLDNGGTAGFHYDENLGTLSGGPVTGYTQIYRLRIYE